MARGVGSSLRAIVIGLAGSVFLAGSAGAGPPYRTDDPEPVEYQHWEHYTFTTGTHIGGDTGGVAPGMEFNYGIIPNGQLHLAVTGGTFDLPTGSPAQYGPGDTEIGFKYRFIQEDKDGARPMVGVFPMVEAPTGNHSRALGAGHVRVYLPLWLQKSLGDWTTYGGGGYWINRDDEFGDKNYWFFGWLLQKKVTDRLTIGGEIYHQTANNIAAVDSTGFNVGAIYDLDEHNHLLVSAGRGLQNASRTNLYSWYLAWQITY